MTLDAVVITIALALSAFLALIVVAAGWAMIADMMGLWKSLRGTIDRARKGDSPSDEVASKDRR